MRKRKFLKLRGKIIENYGTYRAFSNDMGWQAPSTCARKLAGLVSWSGTEKRLANKLLGLGENYEDYFRP